MVSEKAYFYLCGYVKSRNAVHWELERPNKVLTKPLHSTKVTVWAAMRNSLKPIGLFFFEDDNQATVTVSSEPCTEMASTPSWRIIGKRRGIERDMEWFQKDGASAHTY